MAKISDNVVREAAVQINRIAGLKTAYGNDHFKALGIAGPFVRVNVNNGVGKKLSYEKILKTRNSILKILDGFYKKHRPSDLGSRFVLRDIGIYGDFLILNQNADIATRLHSTDRSKLFNKHAQEFATLSDFLNKQKFANI